jgi:hypothetical protein
MDDIKVQTEDEKTPFYKKPINLPARSDSMFFKSIHLKPIKGAGYISLVLDILGIALFYGSPLIFSQTTLQSKSGAIYFVIFEAILFFIAELFGIMEIRDHKAMGLITTIISAFLFVCALIFLLLVVAGPV